MAQLSERLLSIAILAYVLAMLLHTVEYAFGRSGAVARAASRGGQPGARERELVAAGVPAGGLPPPPQPPPPAASAVVDAEGQIRPATGSPRATQAAGWLAVALTVAGVLAHAGAMVSRGAAAGRVPWGNMYEFVIALSLVGAVTWLVLLATRPTVRLLGLFVTLVLSLVLGYAALVLTTAAGPLVPALNSYWLKIHVTAAASASGLLLVAFVPAALFLVRSGYDRGRRSFPFSLGERLPAADTLERLAFRLHAFAFPIWTFAIICGAIWAEAAWGRYWGWDPKETWSFVSWVAYAGYLHARATPSVRRTVATWFAVAAWGTMLINLYVINMVAVGLHSYAGVE